ncbi:MAG: hypothetical protein C0625_16020 [Arcobacter sp.]|nr:MAG: hypothetical protein C0625_16020 [Arcobacter sp.]
MTNIIKSFVVIIAIFILTGCGRQSILSNSLIPNLDNNVTFNSPVKLIVDGGREKDALGIPEISNESLFYAVKKSIEDSKIFTSVVPSDATYTIDLFIVKVGQPVAGLKMKVNVELAWTLKKDNKIIWKKSIITSKIKTSEEIGMGLERLIVATEEATKMNIKEGLKQITMLKL